MDIQKLAISCAALIIAFSIGYYFVIYLPNHGNSDTTQSSSQMNLATSSTVSSTAPKSIQTPQLTTPVKASPTIAKVVSDWGPVIPIVLCNFRDSNGNVLGASQGSAMLIQSAATGHFGIITNQHVLSNGGIYASDCEIQFPNDSQIYSQPVSSGNANENGSDSAFIKIPTPDSYLIDVVNKGKRKVCSSAPSVGDTVVILGYPSIGGSSSITATDGIISAIDGDYFVTSAKVDHGNSGGAAIDLQNDCYLGLPTYVVSGQLESLARILKWQATTNDQDYQAALNDNL